MIKRAEIGQCVFGAVFESRRFHMRIVRHPDNAARNRSRTSQPIILVDDRDFCAVTVRRQSRCQACGSRADDQYVCLFGDANICHFARARPLQKGIGR